MFAVGSVILKHTFMEALQALDNEHWVVIVQRSHDLAKRRQLHWVGQERGRSEAEAGPRSLAGAMHMGGE